MFKMIFEEVLFVSAMAFIMAYATFRVLEVGM